MKSRAQTTVSVAPFFHHWSDDMSVGVRELDSQHRRLIGMINMLTLAMLTGRGQERQRAVVDAMLDYAAVHFAAEERYMKELGFPGYEAHRREHAQFTGKALELKTRALRDGFTLTLEIVDYLSDWLDRHIRGLDQEYEQFSKDRSLQ